jgi:hypothetical protein
MHMNLERRVSGLQQDARQHAESVRAGLRQAAEERREGERDIMRRLDTDRERTVKADAWGVGIVVAGIVLPGIPDGLAAWPPVAFVAMATRRSCGSASR